MEIKELVTILASILGIGIAFCAVPLLMYVIFPFFQSLSPEKRFEKYIDSKCLEGNEIAILIRRERARYYYDKDYELMRAAIEGSEHAIRALKLDPESQKNKFY